MKRPKKTKKPAAPSLSWEEYEAELKKAFGPRYKAWTDDDWKAVVVVPAPKPDVSKN